MAYTVGTILPITPWSSDSGGKSPDNVLAFPLTTATAYKLGDVVVIASGLCAVDNTVPTAGTVLGIVFNPHAAVTTPPDSDTLQVCVAIAGQMFEATMVGTSSSLTDYTSPAFTDLYSSGASALFNIQQDTTVGAPGYAIIDKANGGGAAGCQFATIAFSRSQPKGISMKTGASSLVINPRVVGILSNTVFPAFA